MARLAGELGKLPNDVLIEGHTDAKAFTSDNGYSNWELSADRANSARRIVNDAGVQLTRIAGIRGLADQKLMTQGILDISRKLGLPLVATNDVHYIARDKFDVLLRQHP